MSNDTLRAAVEAWVRADYYNKRQHLLGWTHAECATCIVEAEDNLRRALTGHADLIEAGRALGCKRDPRDDRRESQRDPEEPVRVRARVRERVSEGDSLWS